MLTNAGCWGFQKYSNWNSNLSLTSIQTEKPNNQRPYKKKRKSSQTAEAISTVKRIDKLDHEQIGALFRDVFIIINLNLDKSSTALVWDILVLD